MLKRYMKHADERDYQNLKLPTGAMGKNPYLKYAFEAAMLFPSV